MQFHNIFEKIVNLGVVGRDSRILFGFSYFIKRVPLSSTHVSSTQEPLFYNPQNPSAQHVSLTQIRQFDTKKPKENRKTTIAKKVCA